MQNAEHNTEHTETELGEWCMRHAVQTFWARAAASPGGDAAAELNKQQPVARNAEISMQRWMNQMMQTAMTTATSPRVGLPVGAGQMRA
jgi:hypothetical protein